ncbi:hypothetical protein H6S82_25390, partial [Planktothrix sp. FACHB-1355]|nr:hypothetical protein [Planktothrix sp. FACHB-1355]
QNQSNTSTSKSLPVSYTDVEAGAVTASDAKIGVIITGGNVSLTHLPLLYNKMSKFNE